MYAILGNDIVFDLVKSPESSTDKRETLYSEIALINGKPNLQRTGESLIEFNLSINFNVSFCNPEEEFLKLDNARKTGEVLAFVFSNGRNEGDFVLTSLERTINQTDGDGNFIDITCNIVLKEFANANSTNRQLEQDKKKAFAVSSNRPLPANSYVVPVNPALNVAQENLKVQHANNEIDRLGKEIENEVALVTDAVPNTELINKAQTFVDSFDVFIPKVNAEVGKANNALGSINSIMTAYTSIGGIAPDLGDEITNTQASLTAVSNQLTVLGTLPTTIGNVTDANTALSAMVTMLNNVATLQENNKSLNSAVAPVAAAVATKKILT